MNEILNKINRVFKLVTEEIIANQKNQLIVWSELTKSREKDSRLSRVRIQSRFVIALAPTEECQIQQKVLDTINRLEIDTTECHENQRLFWKRLTQLRKRETYLLSVKEKASHLLSLSKDGIDIIGSIAV
jgi:hypothetical protein